MQRGQLIIIVSVAIALMAGAICFWTVAKPVAPHVAVVMPPASPTVAPAPPADTQSLGAQIYEQTQNPIQDKIPDANPGTNPLDSAYKNPFE